MVIWYHIFETGDPNIPDLLIMGNNQSILDDCLENTSGGDIIISDCGDFSVEGTTSDVGLGNWYYKVVQRSFGPWIDFGHFPVLPNLYLTKNNFLGDNRGFHLGDHTITADIDPDKASSRVYQEAEIMFQYGNSLVASDKRTSGTKGIKNMCPEWIPAFIPGIQLYTPCGGAAPCNWDCEDDATVSGVEWASFNSLYMHSYARDECVAFSTNIDMRSKFVFAKSTVNGKNYLDIKGILFNKGFPSYETFITDSYDNRVFLYTYGPEGEDDIVIPGLLPIEYDEFRVIHIRIEIDDYGVFLNEIIVGESINIPPYNGYPSGVSTIPNPLQNVIEINCSGGQPLLNFSYSTYSIYSWNQLNLNKNPAGDCGSIPCCGNLGCCDD